MDFRAHAEKEAAEFVARLTRAATDAASETARRVADEAKRAAEEAKKAADEALKTAEANRAEALKVGEALKLELQATVKQKMAVAASLKEAQAQIESVRGE